MHFNVAQLMRELGGSTRTYQVEDEPQAPDIFPTRSVRGTVKLMRTDSGVWVSAFLTSSAPSICSRCLEEYAQPVTAHLEEEFFPVWAEDSEVARNAPDGSGTSNRIDEDNILDITDAVQQYLALSLPMKPVCSDGCQGLCPTCGGDRNQTACDCNSLASDPRWEPLLRLAASREWTESLRN